MNATMGVDSQDSLMGSCIFNVEIFVISAFGWLAATTISRVTTAWSSAKSGFKDALLREFRQTASEREQRRVVHTTAAECNYLNFLWVSMCLCLTLTWVNSIFLFSAGHPESLGLGLSCITSFSGKARMNLQALLALAIMDGLVALAFGVLLAIVSVNEETLREKDVERTLWFTSLPSYDKQTWYRFQLTDADIRQVEHDLVDALNRTFQNAGMLGDGESAVEVDDQLNSADVGSQARPKACVVVPVLDKWDSLRRRHEAVLDEIVRHQLLLERARLFPGWARWRLRCKLKEQERLQQQLEGVLVGKKGLSGTAFITFRDKRFQEHLVGADHSELLSVPQIFSHFRQLRPYSYFSFGRAPFGSVTLRCRRAPLPSDVEWKNLHIKWGELRFALYSGLLFIVMLLLVTPTSMAAVAPPFAKYAKAELIRWRKTLQQLGASSEYISNDAVAEICSVLDALANSFFLREFPTLILLAINSLALPYAIEALTVASHCKLKSDSETKQKVLNQTFLVINMLIFPLLGVGSISALAEALLPKSTQDASQSDEEARGIDAHLVDLIVTHVVKGSPGIFALKYLLNAAFISSAIALTNLPQTVVRGLQRWCAVTDKEKSEADTPWPFAWGYWYAWAVSALVLTLVMGIIVPSVYPVASVLFLLRYLVDRHNLKWGVYEQGAGGGRLAVKAACDIPLCVSACWCQWAIVAMLAPQLFSAMGKASGSRWELPEQDVKRFFRTGVALLLAALVVAIAAKTSLLMRKCVSERGHSLSTARAKRWAKRLRLHWPLPQDEFSKGLCTHEVRCDEEACVDTRVDWDYKTHVNFEAPESPPQGAVQALNGSV
mmetsp:Transcript_19597/g.45579  ORF Transcript_19597/g.45579 Transcript_19597/m.45579 type:complete len:836 (-) Transcript_19597:102-2609(-)